MRKKPRFIDHKTLLDQGRLIDVQFVGKKESIYIFNDPTFGALLKTENHVYSFNGATIVEVDESTLNVNLPREVILVGDPKSE